MFDSTKCCLCEVNEEYSWLWHSRRSTATTCSIATLFIFIQDDGDGDASSHADDYNSVPGSSGQAPSATPANAVMSATLQGAANNRQNDEESILDAAPEVATPNNSVGSKQKRRQVSICKVTALEAGRIKTYVLAFTSALDCLDKLSCQFHLLSSSQM